MKAKIIITRTLEYAGSVCRGIAHSRWYYKFIALFSVCMVLTAVFRFLRGDYLGCLWDLIVGGLVYFSNHFRLTCKSKHIVKIPEKSPEYLIWPRK